MTDLKPFLEDMLSMSTGTDGRTLQIHFSRPVTMGDRQAIANAHNAIVRGELLSIPFALGTLVRKPIGSWWEGRAVGFYTTEQCPVGVCVQLGNVEPARAPVQIYPLKLLEVVR